jgi:hypothetical protein
MYLSAQDRCMVRYRKTEYSDTGACRAQDNRKNGENPLQPPLLYGRRTGEYATVPMDGKASGEDEAEPGSLPGIENQCGLRRAGTGIRLLR